MKDKFEEIYNQWSNKTLSCEEASALLHCSVRTFLRKREKYELNGLEAVLDQRIGAIPHNKIPVDQINKILTLRKEYKDYNILYLQQELELNHKIFTSYSSLSRILYMNGEFKIGRKKRKKHRKKRTPKPMVGMMIHQDGSTHNWFESDENQYDLIITMDDANNEIYSAFICQEEGTFSSFRGIKEVIEQKGLFNCLYVDRGSHYGYTSKAGNRVDLSKPTQVARALKQLGIHIIYSNCPQGRGRSERMFRTWQGRLPQELAKNNITDIASANAYIKEVFLPKMNKRMQRKSASKQSGFVEYVGRDVGEILCIQEERVVNNDNTISYKNRLLQLPQSESGYSYVKSKVMVHEYEQGYYEVFHGPRKFESFRDKVEQISNNELIKSEVENAELTDKKLAA